MPFENPKGEQGPVSVARTEGLQGRSPQAVGPQTALRSGVTGALHRPCPLAAFGASAAHLQRVGRGPAFAADSPWTEGRGGAEVGGS